MYHLCAVVGMEPASKASASLQVERESAASCRDAGIRALSSTAWCPAQAFRVAAHHWHDVWVSHIQGRDTTHDLRMNGQALVSSYGGSIDIRIQLEGHLLERRYRSAGSDCWQVANEAVHSSSVCGCIAGGVHRLMRQAAFKLICVLARLSVSIVLRCRLD